MFELKTEEARLLLNIALMAIGRNRFQSALKIMAALDLYRPDQEALASVKAIFFISTLNFQGAVDFIDNVGLVQFPQSAMLQAFKGMAYLRMDKRREAEEPLQIAASQTADPAAAQLARDLLK